MFHIWKFTSAFCAKWLGSECACVWFFFYSHVDSNQISITTSFCAVVVGTFIVSGVISIFFWQVLSNNNGNNALVLLIWLLINNFIKPYQWWAHPFYFRKYKKRSRERFKSVNLLEWNLRKLWWRKTIFNLHRALHTLFAHSLTRSLTHSFIHSFKDENCDEMLRNMWQLLILCDAYCWSLNWRLAAWRCRSSVS